MPEVEVIPHNHPRFQPALKAGFYILHTYSKAPEAGAKRRIDEEIMGNDFSKGGMIDMNSEAYLKELIYRASNKRHSVKGGSSGIEFFIIRGGGEGFLDRWLLDHNADRVVITGKPTTSGEVSHRSVFDFNDLIVAFDKTGKLINSALLQRPVSISTASKPGLWTEPTATTVYDAWDGRSVSLYENTYFFKYHNGIRYYGLWVDDSKGAYRTGWARIDIHKQEQTNGCMFIVDPFTPPIANKESLNRFEPQFIKDIQAAIKVKVKENIGKMHLITLK